MLSKRALPITLIGFMAWGLSSPAFAAKPAVAQGSWAMVDMTKDVNNDGVIDGDGGVPKSGALSLVPSVQMVGAGNHIAQPNERLIGGTTSWYLSPTGFPVTLNACASTGSSYQWSIKSLANQAVTTLPKKQLTTKTCHSRATLPEGSYMFTLTVTSGTTTQSVDLPAQVKNIVFLVMGDSYASGEGNPRNVNA